MFRLQIITLLWILTLVSCEKDNQPINYNDCPTEHFYYYNDEKYYIDSIIEHDYLLIGFNSKSSISEMNDFLDGTNIFDNQNLSVLEKENNTLIIRKFKTTQTCTKISNIISDIQKDNKVDFAAYTYTGQFCIGFNCTELMSYADEFIARLNDTTQLEKLQTLCLLTDTWILEEKKLGRYVIGVDKNSQGNALELANSFYETDMFHYCEPNFHYFNIE